MSGSPPVPLNANPNSPHINFALAHRQGRRPMRTPGITDLTPTSANIVQLVRAARARSKIGMKASTRLKNQGYHLEHNFGHGDQHLSEAFFTLNLIAFFIHQMNASNWWMACLLSGVRTFFSSRRAFCRTRCAPPSGCFCLPPADQVLVAHELAAAAVAPLSGSLVPSRAADSCRGISRDPDNQPCHTTFVMQGSPCAPAAAASTLNRAPPGDRATCDEAGSFCPSAVELWQEALLGRLSALPDATLQAINCRSRARIAAGPHMSLLERFVAFS